MAQSRTLYNGRIVHLAIEIAPLPDGRETPLEIVRHPGGAVIVALDEDRQVCMIRQFRHAAGGWIWELPAGVRDQGEAPELTARRELKEEVGIKAQSWQSLGSLLTTPGFCDERLYLFLAQGLTCGAHAREPDEYIEVHWMPLSRAVRMAANAEIDDAKTVIGLFRVNQKISETTGSSLR